MGDVLGADDALPPRPVKVAPGIRAWSSAMMAAP